MSTDTFNEFAEAFAIFDKYSKDEFAVCAEHDEIFAHLDSETVSEDDKERLEELGWTPNSDVGGFSTFV